MFTWGFHCLWLYTIPSGCFQNEWFHHCCHWCRWECSLFNKYFICVSGDVKVSCNGKKSQEGQCRSLHPTIDIGYIFLSNQVMAISQHCLELLVTFAFPLTFVYFFDIIPLMVEVRLELKEEKTWVSSRMYRNYEFYI